MNCKEARRLIALAARGDVPSPCGLPQHLELCPDCAAFRDALECSLETLQRFGEQTTAELDAEHDPVRSRELVQQTLKSLWRHDRWNRPVFNAWVPLSAAVAIAFATVLLVPLLAPEQTPIRLDGAADLEAFSDRFERVSIDPSWERLPASGWPAATALPAGVDVSVDSRPVTPPFGRTGSRIRDVSQRREAAPADRPASVFVTPQRPRSFVVPVRQRYTDFADF